MRLRICWLGLAAALLGCAPTETGNPGGEEGVVVLGLTAHTTAPAVVAVGASEGGVAVTSATLAIESVSVTRCGPAEDEVRVEVGETIDLVAGGTIELPPGEGCGLAVAIVAGGDAGPPAFTVEGARADAVPVRITSRASATVSVASASGAIDLPAGVAPFLSFDLSAWLGGLALDTIAPDPSGSLVVDGSAHPSIVDEASTALATSATLHFDADGDGALSAEELHAVAASHP